MADRVVRVSLTAQVSNYLAGMEQARKTTEKVGTEAEQAQRKLEAQSKAMTEIGTGMVAMGALALVGVGIAVNKFAEFDQAISNVKAATQESAENMGLLREAALDAGASSVYSATEAANAIEELGKAGLSTADILGGGLDGALSLAAAGGLGVADAAGIAATALKTFNLKGSDMNHVADLMAAGAGKAMGDVSDLAGALGQAGLVANSTGLSIEEATGTLSAFAAKGLLGSDAGTSFKSMLQRLTPQSKEAQDAMDALGISAYDAGGNFIGMEKFAGNLQTSMKDLTVEQRNAAMSTIFGSDAVRASTVLYDEGAEGIKKYIDQTNDSGYAAQVAADRLDNLRGDIEALGGAFDTYLIKSGSGANDSLRLLTQTATGLITAIGDLPEPVLGIGLMVGGLVGAVALAGGAALVAVPKIAAFKTSLSQLGIAGGTAAKGIGLMAGGLAVVGIAFALYANQQAKATAAASEFKGTLDETTGAITNYSRTVAAKKLAESGAFEAAKEAGISQKQLTDAVINGGKELDIVNKKMTANNTFATFFTGVGIRAGNAQGAIRDVSKGLVRAKEDWDNEAAASEGAAAVTEESKFSYEDSAEAVAGLDEQIQSLIASLNEQNGVNQDAASQNANYQQSIYDVAEYIRQAKEGVDGYSLGMDVNTLAGANNRAMLADHAKAAQDSAKATFDADGNMATYRATLEAGHQAVYDSAIALGANADEAKAIADNLAGIPSETAFKVIADTSQAAAKIAELKNMLATIPNAKAIGPGVTVDVLAPYRRAKGGILPGAPSKVDSLPLLAAPGEFVTNSESTAIPANRKALEFINNGGNMGNYSTGRDVQYAAPNPNSGASAGVSRPSQTITITAPAIETQDANTYAAILGREFGRQVAG